MTTELTKTVSANALAAPGAVASMFGGQQCHIPLGAALPQMKIMRETPTFQAPSGEIVKEFTGHIIYWHNCNQFYSKPFGEGAEVSPPDCTSSDGITPDGGDSKQGELCATCRQNQYGSDLKGGRGKACQNQLRIYLLRDGDRIPCIIKAGPSCLNKKDSLLCWLTNANNQGIDGAYQTIQARFKLHTKKFDQFSASVLDIETVRVLSPGVEADMKLLTKLSELFNEFTSKYLGRIASDIAAEKNEETTSSSAGGVGSADDGCPI
jgi:hypothetical protein